MARLRPAQRAFAIEYTRTEQPLQSALTAGYSPKGAPSRATELLAKPEIKALIAKEQALRLDPHDLTRMQHILVLGVYRDRAAACKNWSAVAKLEELRGKALGFQPSGAKQGEPSALDVPGGVDLHAMFPGWPGPQAIGAPNPSPQGGVRKVGPQAVSRALSKGHTSSEKPDNGQNS